MSKILLSANTDWFLFNFRLALAKYLRKEGYEVILVSPTGEYEARFEEEGFPWIRWNVSRKGNNPLEELESLVSLFGIYQKEKPEIVHHHTIKPVIYGSIAARLAGVPKVVNSITGRGYVFQSERLLPRLLRILVVFLYRIISRSSNTAFIFENHFDRQSFIDSGIGKVSRTHLIEGVGVDPDYYHPQPEQDGVPIVMLCGRMLWDKGVDSFVKVARLVKSSVNVRFVLVGRPDPGNPESITEDVLLGWEEEKVVEWWGWKDDMAPVYHQAHIITSPTRYGEGVPTVLIEAAASGKPLVVSDIPGCQAVVREGYNGFLVSPDDLVTFTAALKALIESPELRQLMGANSRKLFLEKFPHSRINEATVCVYQSFY